MRYKFGPSEGNSRAIFRAGKHLDIGIWLTHPDLRGFRLRSGFVRIWIVDIYYIGNVGDESLLTEEDNCVHVHETSLDAIEGEGKVYPDYNPINAGSDSGEMLIGNLPAALIGKRGRYIIFEEKGE